MLNQKNRIAAITIVVMMIISMTASITLIPISKAHTPPYNIPTWAYISVQPNPVGLGQAAYVNFWIDKAPPTAATVYGDRWQNYTVKVTHPDGTTETLGPFASDDTGGAHTTYTPSVLGNYTFQFSFSGQTLAGSNPPPAGYSAAIQTLIGDYYQPSMSSVVTLTVQSAPIPSQSTAPLPTGYWQRPIYGENLNWYSISGNWLGLAAVGFTMVTGEYNYTGNYNPYTTAPASAHILWTQPLAAGGLIGGEFGGSEYGSSYYSTSQYEPKFGGIVINGVLYYQETPGSSSNPAGWVALNLRTGKQLWFVNTTLPLLCGQMLDYITPNQYGGIPYLWSTLPTVSPNTGTTYGMFDAMTGNYVLSIVNGTSFSLTEDDSGDLIGYYVNTSTANAYHAPTINMWNSTQCILVGTNGPAAWQWRPTQGAQIDFRKGIMWSMPLATNISGVTFSPNLGIGAIGSNMILMTSVDSTLNGGLSWLPPWRIIAGYSSITGQQIWGPINETVGAWARIDTNGILNGMWFEFNHESLTWSAYNALTGQMVWTSDPYVSPPWAYFVNYKPIIAYGMLYASDFGGQVHAYNITTGKQVWQFSTGSAGYDTPYGIWPLVHVEAVGGGEVFVAGGHTYSPPMFIGAQVYAINATTGALVWSDSSFDDSNGASALLADGIFLKPNAYNNVLYAYGQGQTATTLSAPQDAQTLGSTVLLQGTVTDQSSGNTCLGIPAAGTPAISDASMTQWMDYLYDQQPEPMNATGVQVTLSVLDSNNNKYDIGTTVSDINGKFALDWTPTVPGIYMITATFAGSNSYFGSSAETAVTVQTVSATVTPAPVTLNYATTTDLMMYLAVGVIAIIIAIAIVGLLLLRKKP